MVTVSGHKWLFLVDTFPPGCNPVCICILFPHPNLYEDMHSSSLEGLDSNLVSRSKGHGPVSDWQFLWGLGHPKGNGGIYIFFSVLIPDHKFSYTLFLCLLSLWSVVKFVLLSIEQNKVKKTHVTTFLSGWLSKKYTFDRLRTLTSLLLGFWMRM